MLKVDKLLEDCINDDRTPGKELEQRLNRDYGPGNEYYEDFCKLIKQGWEEGWVATGDLDNGKYRRGRASFRYNLTCSHR